MKAYGKRRSTTPFIVNSGSRWRAAVNFTSLLLYPWERKNLQCPLNMVDEHHSQSGWMGRRRRKKINFTLTRI
jgi:hypothetical protein